MSDNSQFDAALPAPYSAAWRQAERAESEDAPRRTSYQAPGAGKIIFILDSFNFRGGQSVDTAEYPFNGLWSNERLNEKPQTLHVQGFIRGAEYIKIRNALIESLRVATSDDAPGYIDLPFWGRFPIVVIDYEISEKTNEKGQCEVSLDFTRAGVTLENRAASIPDIGDTLGAAVSNFQTSVLVGFEKKLSGNFDLATLFAGFGKIKTVLAGVVGRIQATETMLNAITAEINGISSLIAQGILAPVKLAQALTNSIASIVAGLSEIRNAVESYMGGGSGDSENSISGSAGASSDAESGGDAALYPAPEHNNEKNVLLNFFSAADYTMDVPSATVAQQNTKEAMENLYRAAALCAVSQIITQTDVSYQKTQGYWNLLAKLEASVDVNDPAVYTAVENMRIAVSQILSSKELSAEMVKTFNMPLPLLYIARYLGCDEAKIRELNLIADSFAVKGDVVYV
jgi:hypothetical protein